MIVGSIILFAMSVIAFVMSIRSFMEKGFLFNNAYIHASEQERESMDKKPFYRQSGFVFLLIGIIFLLNGFNMLFDIKWVFYIIIAIVIITFVYAIVSSVVIGKNNRQ